MNYRIIRTSHIGMYQRAIKDEIAAKVKNFEDLTFAEKVAKVFELSPVYSDSFSRSMIKLGNDALEIIYDFEMLQKSWAHENGVSYSEDSWKEEILLAQIKSFRPEVLHFQGDDPFRGLCIDLKREVDSLKVVAVHSGFPEPDIFRKMKNLDIIFSGTPEICDLYSNQGLNAKLLYHGFDTRVLDKIGSISKDHIFTFSGSSGFGYGMSHRSRYVYLKALLKETNLEAWLYEKVPFAKENPDTLSSLKDQYLQDLLIDLDKLHIPQRESLLNALLLDNSKAGFDFINIYKDNDKQDTKAIPQIPLSILYKNKCHEAVFGIDMYRLLAQSKMTFHKHTDAVNKSVGAMRLFDATGVGTCLISDTAQNMSDLFEEDKEIVTYSTYDECREKILYLQNNPSLIDEIAKAGQRKTLTTHSIDKRCELVHSQYLELLKVS